jgi:class 3 adenylate cyclase
MVCRTCRGIEPELRSDEAISRAELAHLPGTTTGPVVFRDGDYFGRTVDTAARITDYARPREVLVGEDVVTASQPQGFFSMCPWGPCR